MKKTLFVFIATLFAIVMTACNAPTPTEISVAEVSEPISVETPEPIEEPTPESVVVFTDPVLEANVREAMGKPERDITLDEALQVTQLDLSMENAGPVARIADLGDLVQFPNIMYLNLGWALDNGGKAVDISPLAGLTKLEALYMQCDNIDDISTLSGMTGMKDLKLFGNNITDISVLSGMTMMEDLWIQSNQITDISVLSGMTTNLYRLYLDDNKIKDVTPLAGLSRLTSLKLGGNPVEDFSPLADIYPNLEEKDFEIK
jgi:hypothetical protein